MVVCVLPIQVLVKYLLTIDCHFPYILSEIRFLEKIESNIGGTVTPVVFYQELGRVTGSNCRFRLFF